MMINFRFRTMTKHALHLLHVITQSWDAPKTEAEIEAATKQFHAWLSSKNMSIEKRPLDAISSGESFVTAEDKEEEQSSPDKESSEGE
eukprot:1184075-Amphidinium_carterae.1